MSSDYPIETAQCVLIGRMLAKVTDKWTVLIVRVLGRGPRRFNALRREVGEISQKVLAASLRDLEANGLVSRTVTPTNPPQVAYALTRLGIDFLAPVRGLAEWVLDNADEIRAAQQDYTKRTNVAAEGNPAWEPTGET